MIKKKIKYNDNSNKISETLTNSVVKLMNNEKALNSLV